MLPFFFLKKMELKPHVHKLSACFQLVMLY